MKVWILVSETGRGLKRDAALLASVLRERGVEPRIENCAARAEWQIQLVETLDRLKQKLPKPVRDLCNRLQCTLRGRLRLWRQRADLTFHLQRVHSSYIRFSDRNWLIPNPEWYGPERVQYLALVDWVLCKTWESVEAFSVYHDHVEYLGFSGLIEDRADQFSVKDWRRFLHVAGNNRKKGTIPIVQVWARHPEWPVLDLVIEDRNRLPVIPENVRVHERIPESELTALREACGVVLAPSEAEGFGHALLDAMAWGQVVITVDAPPMNELVTSERGFLVSWERSRPCRLGRQYFVSEDSLETAIDDVLAQNEVELEQRSRAARQWVLDNHERFRERFHALLDTVSDGK